MIGKKETEISLLKNGRLKSMIELKSYVRFTNYNKPPAFSASDLNHLKGDIARAYKLIVSEWLEYMKHLKANYP